MVENLKWDICRCYVQHARDSLKPVWHDFQRQFNRPVRGRQAWDSIPAAPSLLEEPHVIFEPSEGFKFPSCCCESVVLENVYCWQNILLAGAGRPLPTNPSLPHCSPIESSSNRFHQKQAGSKFSKKLHTKVVTFGLQYK